MTPGQARRWPGRLAVVLTVAYPFLVYLLMDGGNFRYLGGLLLLVFALRLLSRDAGVGGAIWTMTLGALFALVLAYTNSELLARLYPVLVSGTLLAAFAYTLWHPPSMIERIARATGAALDPPAISYSRSVTLVWCGFFILNGMIAAATAFYGSVASWTLYNGFVSYLLAGMLLAGERLLRPRWQPIPPPDEPT